MEREYNFTVGQKVHTYEDNVRLFGEVVDKTRDIVFILWDIEKEPFEYERNQFNVLFLTHK